MRKANWPALHEEAARNKYQVDFDQLLDNLKANQPTLYAKIQPSYEMIRTAYRSLDAEERKLIDKLINILLPRFFTYLNNRTAIILKIMEAHEWRKAFRKLTEQQKDNLQTKFPTTIIDIQIFGVYINDEAEKTETSLRALADEAARSGLLEEIAKETKNSADYQKLMDALKAKNASFYEKVKPLAEKLRKEYESLPEQSKELIRQTFEWVFANRKALNVKNYLDLITEEQSLVLKKKYDALPKDQHKLLKAKFPFLLRTLKNYAEFAS